MQIAGVVPNKRSLFAYNLIWFLMAQEKVPKGPFLLNLIYIINSFLFLL